MAKPLPHHLNNFPLYTDIDGEMVSHFRLAEFQNDDGLVMAHPVILRALELLRAKLCATFSCDVSILILNALRTLQDNEALANIHGWTHDGGIVAKNSFHLSTRFAVGLDMYALRSTDRQPIPQDSLGRAAREFFDFVKDDYPDGHVHADKRSILKEH